MTRSRKALTLFGAIALIVVVSWVLVAGAVYALGGVMTVEVEDHHSGRDLRLPLPMALLEIASIPIGAAHRSVSGPLVLTTDGVHVGLSELSELGPILVELLEELDQIPDVTLVEVWDGREHVRISKVGSKLRVEVTERDKSIQFSVPTRSVARIADRLVGG